MKRFILASLLMGLTAMQSYAQDQFACQSRAQLQRDLCLRQTEGSNSADRACYDRYLREVQRCRNQALQRDLQQRLKPNNGSNMR